MNETIVKKTLEQAYVKLLFDQPDFGSFTLATDQRELNIAHHYANYILESFRPLMPSINLSCDFDIHKNSVNKRPDIILHERGTYDHQFLVIKVKIDGNSLAKQRELERIRDDWFGLFHYKYGAYINISRTMDSDSLEIEVLVNER